MQCKRCGAENPINRLYCDECGAELEHDVVDVQAALEQEIKRDKAKTTAHSVRWFLGASVVVFVVGILFRGAYKDLPENDIVAFVTPPEISVPDPPTVTTPAFGVALPHVRPAAPPRPSVRHDVFEAQVRDAAFKRAAVAVLPKGAKEPLQGLLASDLVLRITVAGQDQPTIVHAADVASLRPLGNNLWQVGVRSLNKTVQGAIGGADTLELEVLQRAPDGTLNPQAVPLRNIEEIKPL